MVVYSLRRIVFESYPTLLVCVLIGLAAGLTLQKSLENIEGTLVVMMIPLLNGIGGNLASILGARLASALHLGTISPELRGRALKENVRTSALLGLAIFSFIGFIIFLIALVRNMSLLSSVKSAAVFMLAGAMLLPVIILSTVLLAFASFKRGLDPDNIVIPIVTSIVDVAASVSLLIISVNVIGV
ncbi:MAG: magnesium transporter [Candidatus Hadarchaeales archaeon]